MLLEIVEFLNSSFNYKLLYKSCVGCDFTVKASGSSSSNDVITFSDIALQDGFYSVGSKDSNL